VTQLASSESLDGSYDGYEEKDKRGSERDPGIDASGTLMLFLVNLAQRPVPSEKNESRDL
jgi:hypothetical protein